MLYDYVIALVLLIIVLLQYSEYILLTAIQSSDAAIMKKKLNDSAMLNSIALLITINKKCQTIEDGSVYSII